MRRFADIGIRARRVLSGRAFPHGLETTNPSTRARRHFPPPQRPHHLNLAAIILNLVNVAPIHS
jgi:hypothetical protein